MAFQRVARLADLPDDHGLLVELDGREIGLYRVGDQVYAMDNECPHAGYPLHEGLLDGSVIVCPGHGFEYDVESGRMPGTTGGECLARYPVRVEGDEVLIDPDRPLA